MPRIALLVVAIASGVALSSCRSSGSPSLSATQAPTHLSFRQVYETSDAGLTRAEIGNETLPPSRATGRSQSTVETTPTAAEVIAYAALDCSTPANQKAGSRTDDRTKFLVTCGNPDGTSDYFKYLLWPSVIVGSDITAAAASNPFGLGWSVELSFNPDATKVWAEYTGSHVDTAVADVVDGNVFVVEIIQAEIVGPTTIDGIFTKKTASDFAKELSNGNAR